MAKNTTATGSTIDGVTVVHPDNMGNTLVFKDKVYNVNVGDTLTVGEDGLVDVKLSPDSGNLLEARENGLYYGMEAPVDKRFLYVSTTLGVDTNTGSYSSPLRTIKRAFEIINNSGQHHEIRLRAGETFEMGYNLAEQTSISLTSYYDQFISNWDKLPFYRPESSTKWNRPTVIVRKRSDGRYVLNRDRISCRAFYATGINFILDDTDPVGTENLNGNIPGFINAINATIGFEGCIFTFKADNHAVGKYRRDAWLRVTGVTLLNCKFTNKPDDIKASDGSFSPFLYHSYVPSINVNVWVADLNGGGIYEPLTPIANSVEEIYRILTLDNLGTEMVYDKATKTIFGYNPTWDIFNYS